MANYKLPKRFHPDFAVPGRKPLNAVIDWDNPLAKGVSELYIVTSNGIYDAVDQTFYAGKNVRGSERGLYIDAATSSRITTTAVTHGASDSYSFTFLASKTSETSTKGLLTGDGATGDNYFYLSNTTLGTVRLRRNATNVNIGITSIGHDEHVWRTLTINSGTDIAYYAKGQSATTTTAANAFVRNLILGGNTSTGFDLEGDFDCLIVHNRTLSRQEADTLHRDPYQILKPSVSLFAFLGSSEPSGATIPLFIQHYRNQGMQ